MKCRVVGPSVVTLLTGNLFRVNGGTWTQERRSTEKEESEWNWGDEGE